MTKIEKAPFVIMFTLLALGSISLGVVAAMDGVWWAGATLWVISFIAGAFLADVITYE